MATELKASNEEIRSINEELQASNEELETSKEELQSLNEELRTVNQQLQVKVEDLEGRSDDLRNLLNGNDVATLFLDEHLRIRWFTPAMKTLLDLLPMDLGRPVDHFAQRFTNGNLVEDANTVLQPLACEVVGAEQQSYLRRIIPYRTGENLIDGVVITFFDITERKRHEQEVLDAKAAMDIAQGIVDTVREPVIVLTPDLTIVSANGAFYRTFRVAPEETEGRLIYDIGNGQWHIPALQELLERVLPDNETFSDFEVDHHFQGIGRRFMRLNGCRLDRQQLILLAFDDITPNRQTEQAGSEAGYAALFEQSSAGQVEIDPVTGRLLRINPALAELTGYGPAELLGMAFLDLTHEDERAAGQKGFVQVARGDIQSYRTEARLLHKGGEIVRSHVTVHLVGNNQDQPVRIAGVVSRLDKG